MSPEVFLIFFTFPYVAAVGLFITDYITHDELSIFTACYICISWGFFHYLYAG